MNIGAPKALFLGTGRALKNWKLAFVLYALNFLFAAVLALPFATVFMKNVSKSLVGSSLLSGFSYRWYVEFIHADGAYFSSLIPQVILLFATYIVMEAFLAGGFFKTFAAGGKAKMAAFFSQGASNFFPILLVTLTEVILLFLLYEFNAIWAAANRETARMAVTDYQVFHTALWRYAAVAMIFFIVSLVTDFVRAAVAIDDETFAGKVVRGLSFVMKHPLSSVGVYGGASIFSAAVITGWFYLNSAIRVVDMNGIVLEIAVGQIFVLLRIFSKLIFYAGEAALYKENQIEVIKVKPEMLE